MAFEKNIFINCPFDENYTSNLLKPMLYILVKNNFIPRIASEISDSGQARLEKITNIIKECKYGIHDLSIVKSVKANEFARMNMPFELGIDYGLRNSGVKLFKTKKFLILEAEKRDYMKAASDLNGFDTKVHGNKTLGVINCLYSWCSETLKIDKQDPPQKIFNDYNEFWADLFKEKIQNLGSEKLAINYQNNLTTREFIVELEQRVLQH